jgi:hypothetical protein
MKKLLLIFSLSIIFTSCNNETKKIKTTKKEVKIIETEDSENKKAATYISNNFRKYTNCESVYINLEKGFCQFSIDNQKMKFNLSDLNSTTYITAKPKNDYFSSTCLIDKNKLNKFPGELINPLTGKPMGDNIVTNFTFDGGPAPSRKDQIEKHKKEKREVKEKYDKRKKEYKKYRYLKYYNLNTANKEEDLIVQLSFNKTLLFFEIFDNLENDEKYSEKSKDVIIECLKKLNKLSQYFKDNKQEQETQKEEQRKEVLRRKKSIE